MTALADAPPWALALLREARVGRLATADGRGRPLVVPVCFALADDVVYSAIDAKPKRDPSRPLRRVRNIAENPHVALVIDHYEEDWTCLAYVLIHGDAQIVDDPEEYVLALRNLRDSGNYERNFWTLFANRDKLDSSFQNESAWYVPMFFAAAIVGENPRNFDLQMPALSSLADQAN